MLAVFAVVAVVVYWWWPGLVGAGDPATDPDVLVIANGQVLAAEQVVSRRLVEEGFTVAWGEAPLDWCGIIDAVETAAEDRTSVRRAVVLYLEGDHGAALCPTEPALVPESIVAAVAEVFETRTLIVAGFGYSNSMDRQLWENAGATVVDPTTILEINSNVGGPVDCLWWDDCLVDENGDGYVVLRDANGLTPAGQQRVARVLVAEVQ